MAARYEPMEKEMRLLAFVLRRGREPVAVPLGPLDPIRGATAKWRKAVQDGDEKARNPAGEELARRLWRPLEKHLAGATTVLVALSSQLAALPLAALPGKKPGTYLREEITIGYVLSGQHAYELFAAPAPRPAKGLLAVGGIDYTPRKGDKESSAAWEGLPGTVLEAERGRTLFRKAFPKEERALLTGAEATAARFRKELARPYRCLHFAGHGFFAPPTAVTGKLDRLVPDDEHGFGTVSDAELNIFMRNHLLMTGLVLAGAGRKDRVPDILTAEEILGLDLHKTELVVMSACETGVGAMYTGEGVLGLQRAFHTAGASSVISSLWKVDDAATSVLMEEFYANLWQRKMTKLESLRQAQLTVLKEPGRVEKRRKELGEELARRGLKLGETRPLPKGEKRSHPALWAAFVLSGDGR